MNKKSPAKLLGRLFYLNTPQPRRWNQFVSLKIIIVHKREDFTAEDVIGCHFTGEGCSQLQSKFSPAVAEETETAWTVDCTSDLWASMAI